MLFWPNLLQHSLSPSMDHWHALASKLFLLRQFWIPQAYSSHTCLLPWPNTTVLRSFLGLTSPAGGGSSRLPPDIELLGASISSPAMPNTNVNNVAFESAPGACGVEQVWLSVQVLDRDAGAPGPGPACQDRKGSGALQAGIAVRIGRLHSYCTAVTRGCGRSPHTPTSRHLKFYGPHAAHSDLIKTAIITQFNRQEAAGGWVPCCSSYAPRRGASCSPAPAALCRRCVGFPERCAGLRCDLQ